MTTNIPFQQQQPAFKKVGNIAELVRMTPEELKQYNISIDSYRTNLSVMKNERAEGRADGRAEGRAEGIQKRNNEIAIQLLAIGMPIEQISMVTGLSTSEIQALRS